MDVTDAGLAHLGRLVKESSWLIMTHDTHFDHGQRHGIMDGLRGVWHGGPFSPNPKYRFYPKMIRFGTDPVALDRLLIPVIEEKRRAENAVSVFDRSPSIIDPRSRRDNPNKNSFLREPGHIEFATRFGLGVHDIARIKDTRIEL
ncbi:MAG: hypothetical protein EXQ52_12680 [Bryobacterales bacterium]|nr:hypothetical protein [Bryobacterales bacterium]